MAAVKANVWERFWYEVEGFVESFYKDYAGVGNIYEDDEALEVWVAWGREWAMIVKEMIEEDFTPKTGIRVNVNVIPRSAVTPNRRPSSCWPRRRATRRTWSWGRTRSFRWSLPSAAGCRLKPI